MSELIKCDACGEISKYSYNQEEYWNKIVITNSMNKELRTQFDLCGPCTRIYRKTLRDVFKKVRKKGE